MESTIDKRWSDEQYRKVRIGEYIRCHLRHGGPVFTCDVTEKRGGRLRVIPFYPENEHRAGMWGRPVWIPKSLIVEPSTDQYRLT